MNTQSKEETAEIVARLKRQARILTADVVLIMGIALLEWGVYRINHTFAILVAGALAIALGFIIAPYRVAKK